MVISGLQRGGRERRLLELIKGLTKQGFDIYVVSLSSIVEYPYVYDLPITFQIMEGDKMTRISGIRKVIRTFNPDIIHSWDITCSGYLAVSNLFINKPVIQGVIYDASASSSLGKSIRNRIRMVAPLSKAFVANSLAGIRAYQPPAGKSVCIYNGIDLGRFNNLKQPETIAKELLGEPKADRFIVAMIAAFQIRKDYNTFLDVAVTMCRRDKNMTFLLIGEGEFKETLKASVSADLLDKQIFFTGMRQDIESIIQIIDTGVLLTNSENHSEGISNTIVEYMASSKPVIATRGGGTDELVQDNINGYLVDARNADQVISKIELLRNDQALATRMGQKGRQWIVDNFEIKRMTDEYIGLYQRIIEKKPVHNKIQIA
jgi:glycosyltransferase involved in cell wall biosynthesis